MQEQTRGEKGDQAAELSQDLVGGLAVKPMMSLEPGAGVLNHHPREQLRPKHEGNRQACKPAKSERQQDHAEIHRHRQDEAHTKKGAWAGKRRVSLGEPTHYYGRQARIQCEAEHRQQREDGPPSGVSPNAQRVRNHRCAGQGDNEEDRFAGQLAGKRYGSGSAREPRGGGRSGANTGASLILSGVGWDLRAADGRNGRRHGDDEC